MASRRLHGRPVDLGAAYFTVSDPEFARAGRGAGGRPGLARPWTDRWPCFENGSRGRGARPDALGRPGRAAQPGRRSSPPGWTSTLQHEVRHVGPGPASTASTPTPSCSPCRIPQACGWCTRRRPAAAALADRGWRPTIAVAAGWPSRQWDAVPAAFVNGHPVLALVADDGDRRGDGAPVLVAHTTAEVARAHDAEPDGAVARGAGRAARAARRRRPRSGPSRTAGGSPPRPRNATRAFQLAPTASRWPATAGAAPGSRRPGGPARRSPARVASRPDGVTGVLTSRPCPATAAARLPSDPGTSSSLLRRRCPPDRVVHRPDVMAATLHDEAEWAEHGQAVAVVRPQSTAEVAAVVAVCAAAPAARSCRAARAPGCPAGPTPSTAACCCAPSGWTRSSRSTPPSGSPSCSPGVVNDDLRAAAAEQGLWYPPDPASAPWSTIGGNVATNAGGLCCVKYGVTRDYVLALEVVTAAGEVVRVGRRTAKGVAGYDLAGLHGRLGGHARR